MTAVFYISGHGFGHAIRQMAVINALLAHRPGVRVIVRTSVAPWLLSRGLPASVEVEPLVVDIGAVQRGSLEVDVIETVRQATAFHEALEGRADEEARWLESRGASLVVADIPVLAFLAAARVGVKAIGISNFTWDWIYEDYVAIDPAAAALVERVRSGYTLAAEGWRLPMHGGFESFARVRDLPLVARRARLERDDTRRRLGLPGDRSLILVSLGGFGAAGLDLAGAAASLRGVADVVITSYDRYPPTAGLWCVDETGMYGSGVGYEDLLGAVDAVASKPGYGIISDCAANDTALLYTSRGRFREYAVLVAQMPELVRCEYIDQPDLVTGRWRVPVQRLLAQPPLPVPPRVDGASVAAGLL